MITVAVIVWNMIQSSAERTEETEAMCDRDPMDIGGGGGGRLASTPEVTREESNDEDTFCLSPEELSVQIHRRRSSSKTHVQRLFKYKLPPKPRRAKR